MKGKEEKVCKLVKSLYGLKQAPKQRHKKFNGTILSYGFKLNQLDKCVYSNLIIKEIELSFAYMLMTCLSVVQVCYKLGR